MLSARRVAGLFVAQCGERLHTAGAPRRQPAGEGGDAAKTSMAAAKAGAYQGETPNSKDDIRCVAANAAGSPMAHPYAARRAPLRSTRPTVSASDAPSAMRMPISRVRRVTAYDMTP